MFQIIFEPQKKQHKTSKISLTAEQISHFQLRQTPVENLWRSILFTLARFTS